MSAAQDRTMADILLGFELLSQGSTQAWNASGGHSGEPDDRMVATVAAGVVFPHLKWRDVYERASTDEGRARVIRQANDELEAWTRRSESAVKVAKAATVSLVDVILEDGKGHEPEVVARRFGVAAAWVRRIRTRAGHGSEDGKKLEGDAGLAERAAAMSRQGLTQVQIAGSLGVSQPTVHRLLKAQRFRRDV